MALVDFRNKEISKDEGTPFELYEFVYGNTVYRYNTTASEIEAEGLWYSPAPLSRGDFSLTGDARRSQLVINAPSNFIIAQFLKAGMPASPILVTIKKKHLRSSYSDSDIMTEWIGRIIFAEWAHSGVKLHCESYYTSIQGNTNTRYYNYLCTHTLFSEPCKVNKENYKITALVSAINGTNITAPTFAAKPDRYFTGGYLIFNEASTGLQHTRHINEHSGDTIELTNQIPELSVGDNVIVYPGCDHTHSTCKNKFNNVLNFGGFPWIPTRNPFTSTSAIF